MSIEETQVGGHTNSRKIAEAAIIRCLLHANPEIFIRECHLPTSEVDRLRRIVAAQGEAIKRLESQMKTRESVNEEDTQPTTER